MRRRRDRVRASAPAAPPASRLTARRAGRPAANLTTAVTVRASTPAAPASRLTARRAGQPTANLATAVAARPVMAAWTQSQSEASVGFAFAFAAGCAAAAAARAGAGAGPAANTHNFTMPPAFFMPNFGFPPFGNVGYPPSLAPWLMHPALQSPSLALPSHLNPSGPPSSGVSASSAVVPSSPGDDDAAMSDGDDDDHDNADNSGDVSDGEDSVDVEQACAERRNQHARVDHHSSDDDDDVLLRPPPPPQQPHQSRNVVQPALRQPSLPQQIPPNREPYSIEQLEDLSEHLHCPYPPPPPSPEHALQPWFNDPLPLVDETLASVIQTTTPVLLTDPCELQTISSMFVIPDTIGPSSLSSFITERDREDFFLAGPPLSAAAITEPDYTLLLGASSPTNNNNSIYDTQQHSEYRQPSRTEPYDNSTSPAATCILRIGLQGVEADVGVRANLYQTLGVTSTKATNNSSDGSGGRGASRLYPPLPPSHASHAVALAEAHNRFKLPKGAIGKTLMPHQIVRLKDRLKGASFRLIANKAVAAEFTCLLATFARPETLAMCLLRPPRSTVERQQQELSLSSVDLNRFQSAIERIIRVLPPQELAKLKIAVANLLVTLTVYAANPVESTNQPSLLRPHCGLKRRNNESATAVVASDFMYGDYVIYSLILVFCGFPAQLQEGIYAWTTLITLLDSMPRYVRSGFAALIAQLPVTEATTYMRAWVDLAHVRITSCLERKSNPDVLHACVRMLDMLYTINESVRSTSNNLEAANIIPQQTPVPWLQRSVFVHATIATHVNLVHDHLSLRRKIKKQSNKTQHHADTAVSTSSPLEPPSKRQRRQDEPRQSVAAAAAAAAATQQTAVLQTKELEQRIRAASDKLVLEAIKRPTHARDFCFTAFPFLFNASALGQVVSGTLQRQQGRVLLHGPRSLIMSVRRTHLLHDTLDKIRLLSSRPDHLKRPLRVRFEGEEGIDQGGPLREFFQLLTRELLNPAYNMWTHEAGSLVINPTSLHSSTIALPVAAVAAAASSAAAAASTFAAARAATNNSVTPLPAKKHLSADTRAILDEYELTGILMGLSVNNSVLIELPFPRIYWKKLLHASRCREELDPTLNHRGEEPELEYSLQDLAEIEPETARGLQQLLDYQLSSPEDIENVFGLDWTLSFRMFGATVVHELVPGGAARPVTAANRVDYVRAYVRFLLHDAIRMQFDAITRGFFKVCSKAPFTLIQAPEDVELILCGDSQPAYADLEKAATYSGYPPPPPSQLPGTSSNPPNVPVIGFFWRFYHALSAIDKRRLLTFVTGHGRVPLHGMAKLLFKIQRAPGDARFNLPTASTCFSTLHMPDYPTFELLQTKFMLALDECEGFQLH